MFFVEKLNAKFIEENRLCFFKRHLMLLQIGNGFGLIPFELNHTYIVFIVRSTSSYEELQLFNKAVKTDIPKLGHAFGAAQLLEQHLNAHARIFA